MDAISKWAQFVGRVALGTIFVVSGLGNLAAWGGTAAYAGSERVLDLCSHAGLAVLALLIFLVPVTLVFHNFWAVPAQQQQLEMVNFLKNLAIGGGLLIVLGTGAGAFSIDSRIGRGTLPGSPTA